MKQSVIAFHDSSRNLKVAKEPIAKHHSTATGEVEIESVDTPFWNVSSLSRSPSTLSAFNFKKDFSVCAMLPLNGRLSSVDQP
jgi:hypothetical protein